MLGINYEVTIYYTYVYLFFPFCDHSHVKRARVMVAVKLTWAFLRHHAQPLRFVLPLKSIKIQNTETKQRVTATWYSWKCVLTSCILGSHLSPMIKCEYVKKQWVFPVTCMTAWDQPDSGKSPRPSCLLNKPAFSVKRKIEQKEICRQCKR